MNYTYVCTNKDCSYYMIQVIFFGRRAEHFYEFPTLICGCGWAPTITHANGKSVPAPDHKNEG